MNNLLSSPSQLLAPLGVVACDAGAANLIAAWSRLLPQPLYICAEGPARQIFDKAWPFVKYVSLDEVVDSSEVILTGTGWSSDLEHDARRRARAASIQTLAVIDHWVNYQERFIRHDKEILPDVIVVTDMYAELRAKHVFKHTPIIHWPNYYLETESEKIRAIRLAEAKAKSPPRKILMVMEPIRGIWPGDTRQGEFVAVDHFVSNLYLIGVFPEQVQIKIRPHPSDVKGKYLQMVKDYISVNMSLSEGSSLIDDIAWADLVVGCESFALVVALHAGIPTMSMLPPQAPRCRLPHSGLQHLIDLVP